MKTLLVLAVVLCVAVVYAAPSDSGAPVVHANQGELLEPAEARHYGRGGGGGRGGNYGHGGGHYGHGGGGNYGHGGHHGGHGGHGGHHGHYHG